MRNSKNYRALGPGRFWTEPRPRTLLYGEKPQPMVCIFVENLSIELDHRVRMRIIESGEDLKSIPPPNLQMRKLRPRSAK